MKISNNLSIRKIGSEYLGLNVNNSSNLDVTNAFSMNEVSYFIIQSFICKDFTEEDVVQLLINNYEVSSEEAKKDVSILISKLKDINLIEM